jgi:predicted ABC-type ATPase
MPSVFVIGGCNGAGKSTASKTLLPSVLDCEEFVNADAISAALSPFQPESVSFKAGRLMLERIRELGGKQKNFAFETTLSSRTYVSLLRDLKTNGYDVNLIFFHLESVSLAMRRVRNRVLAGGHDIPHDVITRRFVRGLRNLTDLYLPIAEMWWIFDNSGREPQLVARGKLKVAEKVFLPDIWASIQHPQ